MKLRGIGSKKERKYKGEGWGVRDWLVGGCGGVTTSNYRGSDVSLAFTFCTCEFGSPEEKSLNEKRREAGRETKNTPLFVSGGETKGKEHDSTTVFALHSKHHLQHPPPLPLSLHHRMCGALKLLTT